MTAPICSWCGEPVLPGEQRDPNRVQPTHWECGIRSALGGVNHQLGKCSCCGGTEPPDQEGLTRRQAAIQAAELFMRKGYGEVK
jgi:hypothetical protein